MHMRACVSNVWVCACDWCSLSFLPPQLEQSSQHLPLKGKHNVDHLQAAGDFFQDAVLLPQLVQLPVTLWAKVQRIAPSGKYKTQSSIHSRVFKVFGKKKCTSWHWLYVSWLHNTTWTHGQAWKYLDTFKWRKHYRILVFKRAESAFKDSFVIEQLTDICFMDKYGILLHYFLMS